MKNFKKAISMVLLLTMLLLSACSGSAQNGQGNVTDSEGGAKTNATYNLKAACSLADDHPYSSGLYKFGELLEEKSDGRITLDVFTAGQMGGERELVEGIQLGTVDFAVTATAPVANFASDLLVFDLPYLFESTEHAYKVLDSEIGSDILGKLETSGIKGLGYWECGYINISNSKKEIKVPEDVKGLNIRVMENPIYIEYFKELGANPVPMALTELFSSLQNGTVDGLTNPIPTIYSSKFHTVAKYTSRTHNIYIPAILLMNNKLFNDMPADLQEIVVEAANEAKDYQRKLFNELEVKQIELMKQEGAEVIDVDMDLWKDEELLNSVYSKFVPSQIPAETVESIRAMAN